MYSVIAICLSCGLDHLVLKFNKLLKIKRESKHFVANI